jgi:hypothetical protein
MASKKEGINFEKLPKKVLEYIKDIERERETAIKSLNEYLDNQQESPFYYNDYLCTGEESGPSYKTKYIQTHKIEVKHAGVILRVMLRDNIIDLNWESESRGISQVAFVPQCFQGARLVSKENMDK